jgi:hypothetical protein
LLLVANQDSDDLVIFNVNPVSCLLSHLNTEVMPTPACIVFRN